MYLQYNGYEERVLDYVLLMTDTANFKDSLTIAKWKLKADEKEMFSKKAYCYCSDVLYRKKLQDC